MILQRPITVPTCGDINRPRLVPILKLELMCGGNARGYAPATGTKRNGGFVPKTLGGLSRPKGRDRLRVRSTGGIEANRLEPCGLLGRGSRRARAW